MKEDSPFFEKPLPPITDTEWWQQELYDIFCSEEFVELIPTVKWVACKRVVKELQTGTRTTLKDFE